MTLEDILDPISLKTFFTDYWGKQHLILKPDGYHYNIQKFKDIFTNVTGLVGGLSLILTIVA